MYLITAYFDEQANKKLQNYMDVIASGTGNTFMTDHKVPPHMTLSAIEARSAEVLLPAFEELGNIGKGGLEDIISDEYNAECKTSNYGKVKLKSGYVQFVSIGQLLPYVFYATPVLNEYLQDLSGQIYNAMKDIPETTISKLYRPGNWLPHVTLAKTLGKEQMQQAFQMMQERFVPFEAKIVRVGLSRVNPHEDVSVILL